MPAAGFCCAGRSPRRISRGPAAGHAPGRAWAMWCEPPPANKPASESAHSTLKKSSSACEIGRALHTGRHAGWAEHPPRTGGPGTRSTPTGSRRRSGAPHARHPPPFTATYVSSATHSGQVSRGRSLNGSVGNETGFGIGVQPGQLPSSHLARNGAKRLKRGYRHGVQPGQLPCSVCTY